MKSATIFDVLIVYSENIASSAHTLSSPDYTTPFSNSKKREHYAQAYAYFLEQCNISGIKAALTTTKDLMPGGSFESYWTMKNGSWVRTTKTCYSELIYNKFSPIGDKNKATFELLYANTKIKTFNTPTLSHLFMDKLLTYKRFDEVTVPTVAINSTNRREVNNALENLRNMLDVHPQKEDFSKNLVLKNRFGAGGQNIYRISFENAAQEITRILQKNKSASFILQPFALFSKGLGKSLFSGRTDIRLVFLKGKIVQAYIRTAKDGNFLCNEHQGAQLEYVRVSQVPIRVILAAEKVITLLEGDKSLFALDFIITNNGNVFLMEGNSKPGLDWNIALKKNEKHAKRLIRRLVARMQEKVKYTNMTRLNNTTPQVLNLRKSISQKIYA